MKFWSTSWKKNSFFLYLRARFCINSRHSYRSGRFADHTWRPLVYLLVGHRWILSRKQTKPDNLKPIVSNIQFGLFIFKIHSVQVNDELVKYFPCVCKFLCTTPDILISGLSQAVTSDDWHLSMHQEGETCQIVCKPKRDPRYNKECGKREYKAYAVKPNCAQFRDLATNLWKNQNWGEKDRNQHLAITGFSFKTKLSLDCC